MSTPQAFNIMLRMIHLQSFHWFKQFTKGSILMDTALDNIEFALGSNFDSGCWGNVEKVWMQQLGIEESSSSSGNQESSSVSTSSGPLLNDPCAWHLMMDWAEDKIRYGKLDDRMRKYGSRYIHKEWKPLINEIFLQSDPGAEDAVPALLVVQRAMELQGISLTATCAPALPFGASIHTASMSSPGATHRHHLSSHGGVQRKCHKVSASIFIDMDAEEDEEGEEEGEGEGEGEGEEEKEEDEQEEGGSIHCPQQAEPLGKRSYLQSIDSLCKEFGSDVGDLVVINCPPKRQIPTSIFLPLLRNIYIPAQEHLLSSTSSCEDLWPRHYHGFLTGCDIGYIEESADSDAIIILIAPHQLPYDLPKESGESVRFDVELARMAGLDLVPILSPSGAKIGYSCNGQQFEHGLFWLMLPADTLEIVKLLHPNDIRFHVAAGIDPYFVEEMLNLFSAQFWQEQDAVEMVFSLGDTLEIIAGPFCGETGYVVALHEHTIVLVVMWPNQTSEDIKVLRFVMRSHLQDHVLSLGPVAEPHVVLPLSEDKALPGDVVQVHHGLYTSQTGIIEWISPDGRERGKKIANETPPRRAPSTLTLSKDKGYNIAVGDMVEVARGQWCHSQGIVKAVDLIKASLDFMCLEDGIQISVPITFSYKVKEHFDYGLSKFISHDVWVIGGDKKGT
ncbi:hypothetical protein EV401DRAFT_1888956 [Pisolithus croceorrhizus]|nr:hypothetical protein EV401DRAFT_1888956 [Pisolithus croceorrhizus]